MTTRTGGWREVIAPSSAIPVRWAVARGEGPDLDYIRTGAGNVKTFKRRAFAYAYAEQLNRQSAARIVEDLAALGL